MRGRLIVWSDPAIDITQIQLRRLDMTTVCPKSSGPFHIVTYYIKWVTTSSTHSIMSVKTRRSHKKKRYFLSLSFSIIIKLSWNNMIMIKDFLKFNMIKKIRFSKSQIKFSEHGLCIFLLLFSSAFSYLLYYYLLWHLAIYVYLSIDPAFIF